METLVLRRPMQRVTRRDTWILALAAIGIAAASIWFAQHMLVPELDWAAVGAKLRQKLLENPEALLGRSGELALTLLTAAAVGWYLWRVVRYERLILDRSGIRYVSPLPGFLAALQPSWTHSWVQIRGAEITTSRLVSSAPPVVMLDAVTVKRTIRGPWVAEGKAEAPPRSVFSSAAWRPLGGAAAVRELEQSPLMEFMRRAGVKVTVQGKTQTAFALESNPVALGSAIAVLALILYAGADLVINSETYAADRPVAWFVTGGVFALAAGLPLLLRFRVPAAESLALALLLGGAAGAALYPGLLRVNQLTDTQGLRPYEYRMKDFAVWEPVHGGPPTMEFGGHEEYWEQFRRGERREFMLRRGGLGFYQIDMAPVGAEIRAFRDKRRGKAVTALR